MYEFSFILFVYTGVPHSSCGREELTHSYLISTKLPYQMLHIFAFCCHEWQTGQYCCNIDDKSSISVNIRACSCHNPHGHVGSNGFDTIEQHQNTLYLVIGPIYWWNISILCPWHLPPIEEFIPIPHRYSVKLIWLDGVQMHYILFVVQIVPYPWLNGVAFVSYIWSSVTIEQIIYNVCYW